MSQLPLGKRLGSTLSRLWSATFALVHSQTSYQYCAVAAPPLFEVSAVWFDTRPRTFKPLAQGQGIEWWTVCSCRQKDVLQDVLLEVRSPSVWQNPANWSWCHPLRTGFSTKQHESQVPAWTHHVVLVLRANESLNVSFVPPIPVKSWHDWSTLNPHRQSVEEPWIILFFLYLGWNPVWIRDA